MKQIFFSILILFASYIDLQAQNRFMSQEQFRARQKDFITDYAQLEPDEALQFFTLYFELQDKKKELNRSSNNRIKHVKGIEPTDGEYNELAENLIRTRIRINELELQYFKKYQTFLSGKKLYLIQRAEVAFNREMLRHNKMNKQVNKGKKR